jgi:hypothetical protein
MSLHHQYLSDGWRRAPGKYIYYLPHSVPMLVAEVRRALGLGLRRRADRGPPGATARQEDQKSRAVFAPSRQRRRDLSACALTSTSMITSLSNVALSLNRPTASVGSLRLWQRRRSRSIVIALPPQGTEEIR